MIIVDNPIALNEIKKMAQGRFGDMVKAVVDVDRRIMALDGELHADEESLLIENGSKQENLWGINIYPDLKGDEMIEYDSMINLKPAKGNRTRGIEDQSIRQKISAIVNALIKT